MLWFSFCLSFLFGQIAKGNYSEECESIKDNNYTIISIYSLTTVTVGTSGRALVGAQRIGLNLINDDKNIFPNYRFEIRVLDAEGSSITALKNALIIGEENSDNLIVCRNNITNFVTKVNLPIVLGAPWSGLSAMITPALNAFNFIGLSSSASSILLSNVNNFPYFIRMPPNDGYQAYGIINLCLTFNWNKIIILYINNIYGIYLTTSILSIGLENGIEIYSIAFDLHDINSYKEAAKFAHKLDIYIIVLIAYNDAMTELTYVLDEQGMMKYPYYYIGDSAWYEASDIIAKGIVNEYEGMIGMVTFEGSLFNISQYNNIKNDRTLYHVFNTSIYETNNFLYLWNQTYHNNPALVYNISVPTVWAPYAWDSVNVLVNGLKYFEDIFGNLNKIWDNNGSFTQNEIVEILYNIVVNKTSFLGATGNITFDNNGDRTQGFYSFGNLLINGTMNLFGYCYLTKSNQLKYEIDKEKIIWPKDFIEKNMIPQSEQSVINEILVLDSKLVNVVIFFICLSIVIVLILIIFTIVFKNERIIKATSWKLNIVSCFGMFEFSMFLNII